MKYESLEQLKDMLMGYDGTESKADRDARDDGRVSELLPQSAYTMIGRKRLNHLQKEIEDVLRSGIGGDLMECGVWKGGASIFMRAVLDANGGFDRKVWVVDSFEGLHPPDYSKFPHEQHPRVKIWEKDWLRISLESVKENFGKFGLLSDRVEFVKGWVENTLPNLSVGNLAVLRVDVDMYEPTMTVMDYMYPKLSIGGFLDLDDYPAMSSCNKAVEDYRGKMGIREPIVSLGGYSGAYWRKTMSVRGVKND